MRPNDCTLVLTRRNGHTHIEVDGQLDHLVGAVVYLACQVCAAAGKTPKARDDTRARIVARIVLALWRPDTRDLIERIAAETDQKEKKPFKVVNAWHHWLL